MTQGQFYVIQSPDQIPERTTNIARSLRERWTGPVDITIRPHKESRSLEQNALLHIWCREYACHLLNKDKASDVEVEFMKYTLQRHCYAETAFDFLITVKTDLFTGSTKPDRAKTSKMPKGELHQFMNWIQAKAASDGLILIAKGEYEELMQASMT